MSATWILLAALTATGLAQPRDAARVQAGDDLVAWRAIQDTTPRDPAALVAFVQEFPSSPLAELAYRALVELEAELPPSGQLNRLAASYAHHEADLRRRPAHVVVATISVRTASEQTAQAELAPASPVRALIQPVAEGGVGLGPGLYLGAGAELGPVALTVRGELANPATDDGFGSDLGLSLRYAPAPVEWRPFFELQGAALNPRVTGALGLRRDLGDGYALELSGGASWLFQDAAFAPSARIGVLYAL